MYKFLLPVVIVFCISCKNKKAEVLSPAKLAVNKDSSTTFPIMEMLREDADDVFKTPYLIYKITSIPSQKKIIDSIVISVDVFGKIINSLLQIDLSSNGVKGKYSETAFHDLSTKSYSVITNAIDKNVEVKSVTALLNDETNKLKNIYVIMEKQTNDTSFRTTYFWKAKKSLTILKSVQTKNATTETKEFINWNDTEPK
jgi:hypothetical protein